MKKIGVFVVVFICFALPLRAQQTIHLQPLGQVVIPYNQSFKGTPVGGLSGLTYDVKSGQFYVISDDRSEADDARFYSLQVQLNDAGKLQKGGIRFVNTSILKKPGGTSYQKGEIDPEGIAIGSDSFIYVSSEGVPAKKIPPFINAYGTDGAFARAFTIPEAYWDAAKPDYGVRDNLGFEGLTTTPDKKALFAGLENALKQDGPAADSTHGSPARIIVFDLPTGNILHEYKYNVEPIHFLAGYNGGFAVNGLSDLLALDNKGHLLALERNYVLGQGNTIMIYAVSTRGATDIKGVSDLKRYDQAVQPVSKKLVADLSDYDIILDNFEGLALGPKLPGGGRLLLMVSDNNFSPFQRTIFTAFRLGQE